MSTARTLFRRGLSSLPARTVRGGFARSYSNASAWRTPTPTQCRIPSTQKTSFQQQIRLLSSTPVARHGHVTPPKPGEELYVTFVDKEGEEHKLAVSKGDNLLDIAQANDLDMEGACGGSCACSTCHVIVEDSDMFDKIPEAEDDENDMLDLAFGLTETSRLGCQIHMTKELDGLRVKLPSMTRNLQASDFK
ncbi:2Fe-2S iron-sulfur cluster binding domain-containing protein [Thozetella sp. PMI_491]|nr:2Fe-2S iron-sulfur cluster binding domain-containing protein [Thozetella sp. PMI_491]